MVNSFPHAHRGSDIARAAVLAAKSAKIHKHEIREQEPRIEEKPVAQIHQVVPAIKPEALLEPTESNIEKVSHELPVTDASIQQPEVPGAETADWDKQDEAGDYGFDEITLGQEYDGEYITAEQARMYECVEQEIASRWRPPRGLSKDLACQIKCSIGLSGTVVDYKKKDTQNKVGHCRNGYKFQQKKIFITLAGLPTQHVLFPRCISSDQLFPSQYHV